MFEEILSNVTVLAFLAVALAKIVENTITKVYDNIPALAQQKWTIVFWSVALGILVCLRAQIGILPNLPPPDNYILAGTLVGCGASVFWDVILDKGPKV